MSPQSHSPFLQLKIDYVSFMVQMFNLMAYEEDTTGVLFALLMENDYLSLNQLKTLTGATKSTITQLLSHPTVVTGEFPILETRKPGKRDKFYYCPVSFEFYIKRNFTAALTTSQGTMDFIPALVARVNTLPNQSDSTQYVKQTLNLLRIATYLYGYVIQSSENLLEDIFQDSNNIPDFKPILKEALANIPSIPNPPQIKNDSLTMIKKEFIEQMMVLSREIISGNEESIKLFLVLYLEDQPVTQEYLCKITGFSRGKISQILSNAIDLKVVNVIKKPKDRKKYYKMQAPAQEYGAGKLIRVKQYYAQIDHMINSRFLPEVQKIDVGKNKEYLEEKRKFSEFLKENIDSFRILDRFATVFHTSISDELKAYFANEPIID